MKQMEDALGFETEPGKCRNCGYRFNSWSDILDHIGLTPWTNWKKICPKVDLDELTRLRVLLGKP